MNTDDRTLLEAAARAYWGDEIDDVCSIEWSDRDNAILYTHGDNQDHNGCDRTYRWNPLEESTDAFQLAVRLRLSIAFSEDGSEVQANDDLGSTAPRAYAIETTGNDADEATRRAITRAAAQIGATKETS